VEAFQPDTNLEKIKWSSSVESDEEGENMGKCTKCGKTIRNQAVMVGEDNYHSTCFTCHQCGCPLDGKYYTVNGNNFCEKDRLVSLEKCDECGKLMEEGTVIVNEKKFHPHCFVCVMCRKPLDGKFFTTSDGVLCEVDYKQSRDKCHHCGLPMTDRILTALEKKYHPACFRCALCDKSLDGEPFILDGDAVNCKDCYTRLKAKQCHRCGQGIVSTEKKKTALITVNGQSYHDRCYTCSDCGTNLNGKHCFTSGDDLLCFDCDMKRRKP